MCALYNVNTRCVSSPDLWQYHYYSSAKQTMEEGSAMQNISNSKHTCSCYNIIFIKHCVITRKEIRDRKVKQIQDIVESQEQF